MVSSVTMMISLGFPSNQENAASVIHNTKGSIRDPRHCPLVYHRHTPEFFSGVNRRNDDGHILRSDISRVLGQRNGSIDESCRQSN
jgi:hypothetical protein